MLSLKTVSLSIFFGNTARIKFAGILSIVFLRAFLPVGAQEPSPVPEGHAATVRWLTFSPDGKTLLSAGADRTVKLWDVAKGKLLLSVPAHNDDITAVDFAPDGKTFASVGGNDLSIKVWNTADGSLLQSPRIDTFSTLTCVKFSPDGSLLSVGSLDGVVRVFSTQTWKLSFELFEPKSEEDPDVKSIAFSPDGKTLAVADNISIKLWDLSGKNLKWKLDISKIKTTDLLTGKSGIDDSKWEQVSFSPDGKTIACGSEGEIRLVDAATGKTMKTGNAWIDALAFSPDGESLVFTATFWTKLNFLDIGEWKLKEVVSDEEWIGEPIAFSPDGKLIASSVSYKVIKIWDVASKKIVRTFGFKARAGAVAWSPDATRIAVESGDILLFNPQTGSQTGSVKGHTYFLQNLAFSPDGKLLAGTNWAGMLHRGTSATAGTTGEERLYLWDTQTGRMLRALENKQAIYAPAFSPDRKYLATAGLDGSVRIWQPKTGQLMRKIQSSTNGEAKFVTFSVDGRKLAAIVHESKTAKLKVWTTGTWSLLQTVSLPENYSPYSIPGSFCLSPDLSILALYLPTKSESFAHTLQIWNIAQGKVEHDLGEKSLPSAVAYSSDGKLLASAHTDWKIRIWETQTGKLLFTLPGHRYDIKSLAFSPNGEQLLSGSEDGTARIWDARTGALLRIIFVGSTKP